MSYTYVYEGSNGGYPLKEDPPEMVKCEICGDYVDDFEIVTPTGQKVGYCLCLDCAAEMIAIIKEEDEQVMKLLNEEL